MIWRLTYCNKDGVEARLDIIKGSATPVEVIEGTGTPFVLNYKMDKPDKSGFFMTSSADISIFETTSFNIDSLKTSSETEIKVEHYIDNILDWAGFVIPDFFSKTIGSPATVEMVASDRLATLKGVTLTDLNQYTSMRDLAVACLAQTGLSLPLYTLADFGNDGQTNAFFKALGLSSRLSDTKGRNISCYDILKSILVASNSKLVQQDGAWHIVNKWQHEQGVGNLFINLTSSTPYSEKTINFSDVHVGGRRSIIPVAAITGIYHEFGGGRSYPDNFDFRDFELIPEFNFPDWTKGGTFNVNRGNKEIIGYSFDGQMQFGANTVDNYFFNSNVFNTSNYLQMDGIPVPYATGQIEVVLDLNATAQTVSQFLANVTAVKIAVGAVKDGSPTIWLNNSGIFAEDNAVIHNLNFERGATFQAQTKGFNLKGVINNPEGYSIIMRIYGSRDEGEDNRRQIAIHFARIEFKNTQDAPKGTIYKRRQGTYFTKEHDIDTTIFGDYMQKGLDGYFYEYPFDDTSSLYRTAGTLTQPLWTAPNDTEQLPLLHHITRQKSRMFSLAHNMISARINVSSFKPLNIFIDCNSDRHVVVSATYDFLRSEVEVELEQIASTTLNVRDFIYSYFGDGESGISSVGGVSGGGGGGTGGGLTPEQLEILSWWKKDPDRENTIFTEMNAYSTKELSAYGAGDGDGGGGGSDYERLDTWADYDSSKAEWVLSAFLGNDLNTRVTSLEQSGGGGGEILSFVTSGTGNAVTSIEKSGTVVTAYKSGSFLPLSGGTMSGDWAITATEGINAGVRTYRLEGFGILWAYRPSTLEAIRHGVGFGWHDTEWVIGNIRGGGANSYGFGIGYRSDSTNAITGAFRIATNGAAYLNNVAIATVNSNVASATKLQTARTIAGVSFDGTANIAIPFANLSSKPTTLAGYGITDAYTKTEVNLALISKLDKSVFDDLFEKVEVSTGVFAIKAKYNFYGVGEVSAYGIGSGGGGGGGIIETVYGYGNLGQAFNNSILTDTFNAYTINQINTRLVSVESGSATTVNTTGTGNAITSISKSGSVITAYKSDSFLPLTGGSLTGNVNAPTFVGALSGNASSATNAGYLRVIQSNAVNPVWLPDNNSVDALKLKVYDVYEQANTPSAFGNVLEINGIANHWKPQLWFDGSSHNIRYRNRVFNSTTWLPWKLVAFTDSNVASASKLQTPRTIAGVSFDGTANIAIPFANLSSKPTTLGEYGITDAVTLNTAQTITGEKTFSGNVIIKGAAGSSPLKVRGIDGYIDSTGLLDNLYLNFVSTKDILMVNGGGNVGIGTLSPSQKLHVVGNILATGTTTTTKVIFNSAGWSMEQTGTELLLKYNNLIAARFLSDGSIVGLGEITAYGATTGGEGVSLLRTGGTMTGNLIMSADIIMNSGRAIGVSNLPLKLLGNALTYNASNVLTEANTATQIKMGNGWTIEQTTSALTIKKNGVVKGTFNA